jgi:thermitase
MLLTGILTIGAFLLIARGATKSERSPLMMAIGVTLLVVSAIGHIFAYSTLYSAVTALTAEVGVGLYFVAGFLARRKRPARPIFFVGSISLIASVLLLGVGNLFFSDNQSQSTGETTLLVELGPDDLIEELSDVLTEFDATAERAFPNFTLSMDDDLAQVYIVSVPTANLKSLRHSLNLDEENVDHVELNETVSLYDPIVGESSSFDGETVAENDPLVNKQWALDAIEAHKAHEYLKDVQPVRKAKVAILDTGVDGKHEDIRSIFASSPGSVDIHGHGSHCAGIAGAVTNNSLGMASLNWEGRFLDVYGYKALNDQGMGTLESISQAVLDATRDGADVISMSLGGKSPVAPKTISDAIEYAIENGVIVIVSAGNSNEDAKYHMPSNVEGVIVVSAVDESLRKASFSNTNNTLARPITAPGVNILSLKPGGSYVEMSGTSMSTPIVSGLAGIMRSLNPDLSVADAYSILKDTGKTVKDSRTIGVMVNAHAAIESAAAAR